jgi:glycolate oxidase FAD binding subunit
VVVAEDVIDAFVERVKSAEAPLRAVGCCTKTALTETGNADRLSLAECRGIVDYQPQEFTITVRAGTPLREIEAALDGHGQWLTFDPPLVEQGATIGGAIASGLSGPCRLRHGGPRDCVLGIEFIDGLGQRVRGGGRVVKNSAGFDLPKLFVGSCGGLGPITELTLKVLPRSEAYRTVRISCPTLAAALACIDGWGREPLDLDGLTIEPDGTLWARVGGPEQALPAISQRLLRNTNYRAEIPWDTRDSGEAEHWRAERDWAWRPSGSGLVKVPITPRRIANLDAALAPLDAPRRYGVAGAVAMIAWPADGDWAQLDALLAAQRLAGLVIFGRPPRTRLGQWTGEALEQRVAHAIDPLGRFARG